MIYDCFIFYNELELLELRLGILADVVDKFVIVEATKSFSNRDKPLYYLLNQERYQQWAQKIIYIPISSFPEYDGNPWRFEEYQRNCIMLGLKECQKDDVIIISDVDEIPDPVVLLKIKDKPGVKSMDLLWFNYYLNYLNIKQIWWTAGPKVFFFDLFYQSANEGNILYNNEGGLVNKLRQDVTPNKIRRTVNCKHFKNGGWHFSYLGGAESVLNKVKNYSHSIEFKKTGKTLEDIEELIRKGVEVNPVSRATSTKFYAVTLGRYSPIALVKNQKKYEQFLLKDTKSNGVILLTIGFWRAIAVLKKPLVYIYRKLRGTTVESGKII